MTAENADNPTGTVDLKRLKIAVFLRIFIGILTLSLMFFAAAGTLRYWQAWTYMAVSFIPMFFVMIFLLRRNPELLERRIRMKEKERGQKKIVKLASVIFVIGFLLPGFDHRFGWSSVPTALVVAADAMYLLGYGLFVLVLRENPFAARTVEVEQNQKVITTGPYAVVRHPLYSAVLLIYGFSPLALGSYWALIPFGLTIMILVARILNEEKVLLKDLDGYREYTQETRYRLIPHLW
jgi:protein-S-isoprenylcysteine O-methyltransferase Ste14